MGDEEAGSVETQPGAKGGGEGADKNRRKGDKRFEGEGGVEGGQIEQWRYTSWRSPRRKS